MKATFLLLAFGFTAPLFGADTSKIFLKGTSVSVEEGRAAGAASAVVGELTISADVIIFDKEKNLLRCEGAVVVRTSTGVVTAKDCTVELVAGEKKVFFLSRGDIRVAPAMKPLLKSLIPEPK